MRKLRREIIVTLDGLPDEFALTVKDVAAIEHSSPDKVTELLTKGKIPGMYRFGCSLRITAGDLRKYRAARTVGWPEEIADLMEPRRRRRTRPPF